MISSIIFQILNVSKKYCFMQVIRKYETTPLKHFFRIFNHFGHLYGTLYTLTSTRIKVEHKPQPSNILHQFTSVNSLRFCHCHEIFFLLCIHTKQRDNTIIKTNKCNIVFSQKFYWKYGYPHLFLATMNIFANVRCYRALNTLDHKIYSDTSSFMICPLNSTSLNVF